MNYFLLIKKSIKFCYNILLGKDDESLDQPKNASIAEQEVEVVTIPVDGNLFLQLAVRGMNVLKVFKPCQTSEEC